MNTSLIILIAVIVIALVYCAISRCFDDDDPDLYWYDNYAAPIKGATPTYGAINCKHDKGKTDIVVDSTVTCEEVWTICDYCQEVLNKRTDC